MSEILTAEQVGEMVHEMESPFMAGTGEADQILPVLRSHEVLRAQLAALQERCERLTKLAESVSEQKEMVIHTPGGPQVGWRCAYCHANRKMAEREFNHCPDCLYVRAQGALAAAAPKATSPAVGAVGHGEERG